MKRFKAYAVLFSIIPIALAADCSQPRPTDGPSASDLASFISSEIPQVCTGGQTGGSAAIPANGYVFFVEADDGVAVNATLCTEAFQQIVDQCINQQDFFGGQFVFDGQLFNLTNARTDNISPALAVGFSTDDGSGNTVPPPPPPPPPPPRKSFSNYAGDMLTRHSSAAATNGRRWWGRGRRIRRRNWW